MTNNLDRLREARSKLLIESKFWNRNRLFLAWAFCAAIILTTGIEITKIISKDYYLFGMIVLFVFGLVIIWVLGRIIDRNSNDIYQTYKDIDKIIKETEERLK